MTLSLEERLELECLIGRRTSVDLEEFERLVIKLRASLAADADRELDTADLCAPEEPWYLEARCMALEAALDEARSFHRYRLPDLRRWVREAGLECQIRLPTVCMYERTTQLCHARRSVTAGAGRKPSDLTAFIGCTRCHDVYDRRAPMPSSLTRAAIELAALDAIARTHELYRNEWGIG